MLGLVYPEHMEKHARQAVEWRPGMEEGDRRVGQHSFSKISIYYILRSSICKKLITTMGKFKGICAN